MKALLSATAFFANASLAVTAPWATDTSDSDGDIVGGTAYQWEDGGGNGLFGYECDALFGFEAFYVPTEERYEERRAMLRSGSSTSASAIRPKAPAGP